MSICLLCWQRHTHKPQPHPAATPQGEKLKSLISQKPNQTSLCRVRLPLHLHRAATTLELYLIDSPLFFFPFGCPSSPALPPPCRPDYPSPRSRVRLLGKKSVCFVLAGKRGLAKLCHSLSHTASACCPPTSLLWFYPFSSLLFSPSAVRSGKEESFRFSNPGPLTNSSILVQDDDISAQLHPPRSRPFFFLSLSVLLQPRVFSLVLGYPPPSATPRRSESHSEADCHIAWLI